jgi:hypothetical protein
MGSNDPRPDGDKVGEPQSKHQIALGDFSSTVFSTKTVQIIGTRLLREPAEAMDRDWHRLHYGNVGSVPHSIERIKA